MKRDRRNRVRLSAGPVAAMLVLLAIFSATPIANVHSQTVLPGLSNCEDAVLIQSYSVPLNSGSPAVVYIQANGTLSATSSGGTVRSIVIPSPLPGPISVVQCVANTQPVSYNASPMTSNGDPQLGYTTTNSAYWFGTQDNELADWTLLTANPNIMIGMGFEDNQNTTGGNWYHIGIGNNVVGYGGVQSGCSSPPVIWGEYSPFNSTIYYELPLLCGAYSNWYKMDIVVDTTGIWWYFVNSQVLAGVYVAGNPYPFIGAGGTGDFIEATSTPGQRSSTYSNMIFIYSLQYAQNMLNYQTLNLGGVTFANPSSLNYYNGYNWVMTYWSETSHQWANGFWSISYTWY